jgi:hypothetical protein
MDKNKYMKNYGLLPDLRSQEMKDRDFIFGADNGVNKVVLMPDLSWFDDTLIPAKQHGVYFDSMGCVSFSLSGQAEYVFNRMIELGLVSKLDLDWLKEKGYFDANNKINFSERYLAKMSGTTRQGNALWKVVDTAKHYGFIPYGKWTFPSEQRTPVFDWDDFYAEIPQELIDLGIEFAKRFNIQYEQVFTSNHELMKDALKYAPPQITLFAYPIPENDIYPKDERTLNHAVVGTYEDTEKQLRFIRDSYQDWYNNEAPYYKKLAWDYIYGSTGYILYFNSSNDTPMIFRKEMTSPNIYLIIEGKKILIIDMPTWTALGQKVGNFEEVESLAEYADGGTLVWSERIIN